MVKRSCLSDPDFAEKEVVGVPGKKSLVYQLTSAVPRSTPIA